MIPECTCFTRMDLTFWVGQPMNQFFNITDNQIDMKIGFFFSIVLFVVLIVISYRGRAEGFTSAIQPAQVTVSETSPVMEYQPNGPDHADLDVHKPYHLLQDCLAASSIKYAVGSQTCYDADFEQKHNKTGNFSQCTNNYKRNHPDSCSGSRQEFIMNFYQK